MNLLTRWLGPKSKYDETIPYTYQARLPIPELEGVYHTYQADTICGLVEYLHANEITPDEVEIYEEYQGKETLIQKKLYTTPDNQWLFKPQICQAFEAEYQGHIHGNHCSFEDRHKKGAGPF